MSLKPNHPYLRNALKLSVKEALAFSRHENQQLLRFYNFQTGQQNHKNFSIS